MRVAFFTHYTALYGANRSLLNLIDGLRKYDVVPYVVAPAEGDVVDALRCRGVPVLITPLQLWVGGCDAYDLCMSSLVKRLYRCLQWRYTTVKRLYGNIRIMPTVARQLRLWGIDIVYTNTSVIPVGAMVASMIQRPHVWHLREFSDLHFNLRYDWGKDVFRYTVGRAAAQIAISKAVHAHHLGSVALKRTHIIYNGVASVAEFDRLFNIVSSTPTSGRGESYIFALVGVIHPAKGQDIAIKALALLADDLPQVHLLIVGGGGGTEQLQALAESLGVSEKVEFWGHIDDPYKAYLTADAVLMCSKYEAMGRVTAEAMSACRPVIGYDQAGTSEIIEHEHTGLLYRGGPEELACCMRQFVEKPGWARQLGLDGWRIAREKYSIEVYAQRVYEVLLAATRSRNMPPLSL